MTTINNFEDGTAMENPMRKANHIRAFSNPMYRSRRISTLSSRLSERTDVELTPLQKEDLHRLLEVERDENQKKSLMLEENAQRFEKLGEEIRILKALLTVHSNSIRPVRIY